MARRLGPEASSAESILAYCRHRLEPDRTELVRVMVDTRDSPETRELFAAFREQLKTQFGQLDISVTSYPIEVV